VTGKRLLDIAIASAALIIFSPVIALLMLAVSSDRGWPIYGGIRVGCGNRDFTMFKLRTMSIGSELTGGTSTSRSDPRVTLIGRHLRRWKLDELPQFWNVLVGDMSLVGPRPNTRRGGVDRYTADEMRLLTVRPGITDLSSIVFSDEGDILEGAADADAAYDRLIRPWKSELGLLYIERRSFVLDLQIIALTAIAILSRPTALREVGRVLGRLNASPALIAICRRRGPLPAAEVQEQAGCGFTY
jgi:lipopolysaccharide/colanic/teichoic acid biosynthesis glycosyltransferase